MAKKGVITDPHAEREAAKYDNPIPSREVILEVLRAAEKPLNHNKLSKKLALEEYEQVEALRKRLRAMERDGQIMSDRKGAYGLVDKMNLVHCRVQGHRDGYGFAMPLGEGEDIYLSGATLGDHDFIAAARQDVPRLLAEVRRLRETIAR